MGEYTRAAYMPTDGCGGAAEPGRRVERITIEEFRLRIGAVRTRRRNAEAAFKAHDDIELGAGWSSKNHAKLEREVLEARGEELRLVHLLLGEHYAVEMGEVQSREQPCLVEGGGA